jgi:signal transduction histidine kinase
MAVRLTLQRALLGTIAVALLVGLVPAAIALDGRLTAALLANARTDLEMAPGVLADRTTSHATMLSMHAEDFAGSAGLAAALARQDTTAVRRLADSARPTLGGEPMVISRDGVTLVGPMARPDWLVKTQQEGPVVTTTAEGGAAFSVALAPVRDGSAFAGAAGVAQPIDASTADLLARLTRADVTVLVGTGDAVSVSTLDSTHAAALRQALIADTAGTNAREHALGSRVVIAVSAPLAPDARIVFSRFRDAELAVIPELRRVAAISAILAIGIALILGAVMAARVARPARELSDAAVAVSRGSFDAPLPTSSIAEISNVAEQFGVMRTALERQMTELRRANDALEDRNARLVALQADLMQRDRLAATGRLVGHLAHEIRNPVANLRNLLELVRRRVADDPQARDYADLAIDELLRMHELAEQMLDLNRPRDPTAQRSDPLGVARDVVRLTTAGDDGTVQVDISGTEGLSAGLSPDSLKQVLLNLVQNAREALRAARNGHPTIGITVRGTADGVEIVVQDNGPGVPRELRTRIFDPFFTTKGAVDGVGLGLFVAEGLVRSAGGRLTLDDSSGGARFVVELPRAAAHVDQTRTGGEHSDREPAQTDPDRR